MHAVLPPMFSRDPTTLAERRILYVPHLWKNSVLCVFGGDRPEEPCHACLQTGDLEVMAKKSIVSLKVQKAKTTDMTTATTTATAGASGPAPIPDDDDDDDIPQGVCSCH